MQNGVVTTYTVDDNDRLTHETEAGVTTLRTYDDNGNTTYQSKPGEMVEYGYDGANRLVRTVNGNGTAVNVYNADGIRHIEVLNNVATVWVIDPNRDYAQTLEAYRGGQLSTVWHFGDDLMAQANVVGGSVVERSLLADGMGSVRQATDATGSVTDSFEYNAFGEVLARSGESDIDHRFRGEQLDPNTGFYNLRARWYDANSGRFATQDSWLGSDNDPASLHKYLYANSDPANGIDPSGRTTLSELSTSLNASMNSAIRGFTSLVNLYDRVENAIAFYQLAQSILAGSSSFPYDRMRDALRVDTGFRSILQNSESALSVLGTNMPRLMPMISSAHLAEIEKTIADPSMAFAIFTPTPYVRGLKLPAAKIPLADIKIGKQSKKVYMYIGGSGRGRFTGVGWTRAGKNLQNGQWMRMDWHDDHGKGDYSDQGFHFHVRRLEED